MTQLKIIVPQIPLSHFSSEEVNTWSSLDSPRVVELFGAVREGPSVVLFMDLKPGRKPEPFHNKSVVCVTHTHTVSHCR